MAGRVPSHILQKLKKRKEENAFRSLNASTGIDFSSNDFLGMARNPDFISKTLQAFQTTNPDHIGSGGSRLLSGHSDLFEKIEHRLASYFRSESALLFNSGYATNLALLSSVPQRGDLVLYDEQCHASIKDGIRLSLADKKSFKHNNTTDLHHRVHSGIQKNYSNIYVVVESLYSMDGDFCALKTYLESIQPLKSKFENIFFIVDEAHSTGLYGSKQDSGSWVVAQGLESEVFARVHTFGKAFGVSGGCVVGSNALKEYLINFARPFIYTTAATTLNLVALDISLDFIQQATYERQQLFENISTFKKRVETHSDSAIQPVIIPGNSNARKMAKKLYEQGFDVRAVLSPTVPSGTERIRVCIHSFNTREDVEKLANAILSY